LLHPSPTPTPPSPPDAPAASPTRLRTVAPRLIVSLLIAAGFVWLLQRGGLPILPPADALARLAWWAAPVYVGLNLIAVSFRTHRWLHLLRPIEPQLSRKYVFGTSLASFAAVVFAPLRMGEVARPLLISRSGRIGFMQASGTVAAERVVDGLLLMSILAAGLGFATPRSPLPTHIGDLQVPVALVPTIASSALLMFSVAFTIMIVFYSFRQRVSRLVRSVLSVVSTRLADWVISQLERVSDGLRFLPSRRHGGSFLRETLLYWSATAIANWLLLIGAGIDAGFDQACVLMGVMGLGSLLPSGPGFFGTYQLGAYCGLALFFPNAEVVTAGAVFIFVSYTGQLAIATLAGLWGLRWMALPPLTASAGHAAQAAPATS
jgi:uncharacterized protein (TIRG00374 family)